ncbi:hypothetical protein ABIA00_004551 [Bradyrhizobium ottawaense]|uniref:hypothetical protein n=1 Tax=Bradyrhizobium ottawaense TaxID=931866 RepID=UPI003839685C
MRQLAGRSVIPEHNKNISKESIPRLKKDRRLGAIASLNRGLCSPLNQRRSELQFCVPGPARHMEGLSPPLGRSLPATSEARRSDRATGHRHQYGKVVADKCRTRTSSKAMNSPKGSNRGHEGRARGAGVWIDAQFEINEFVDRLDIDLR